MDATRARRYSAASADQHKNVSRLWLAWTYHTGEQGKALEGTPILVDNTLYFPTQNLKIVALEPETGREIWKYDPHVNGRELRGVSYWAGDQKIAARILFGTADGRLIALDAKTGKPVLEFGDNGVVNLRTGVVDNLPKAAYAITSPPMIYRDIAIVGPSTQEGPTHGPRGDPEPLTCTDREACMDLSHPTYAGRAGQ